MTFWTLLIQGAGLAVNIANAAKQYEQIRQGNIPFRAPQPLQIQRPRSMFDEEPKLELDLPKFPKDAFNNFEKQQQDSLSEKNTLWNILNQETSEKKDAFFLSNNYKTETDNEGNQKLLLDKNQKPIIESGTENKAQKELRQEFFNNKKEELVKDQAVQKQVFFEGEKTRIRTFMDQNLLLMYDNPNIQKELQELLYDSKKKALKLKNEHERELLKLDSPSDTVSSFIDVKMDQFIEKENKSNEELENSDDTQNLKKFQEDLANILELERSKIRNTQKEEEIPSKIEFKKPDPFSFLPQYLVDSLSEFEIYSL